MSELNGIIIGTSVTTLVGLVIVGIVTWGKRRLKVTGPTVEKLASLADDSKRLSAAMGMMLKIQLPQLKALHALLVCTKGQVNGEIEKALEEVDQARCDYNAFLLAQASGGGAT